VRTESGLRKSFTVSLLLHAGLLGGLVLFVSRSPMVSDTPLRVRILEEPAPQAVPQPPAPAAPPRQEARRPVAPPPQASQRGKPEVLTEKVAPLPVPVPEKPPSTLRQAQGSGQAAAPPALPPAPPQAVARPAPEVSIPAPKTAAPPPDVPREVPREVSREALRTPMPPVQPERGGLVLGGPSQSSRALPPASSEPTAKGPSRPSLRDQIASLDSKVIGEAGEAKRTMNMDDRQPDFLPYLERLKRRVYNVWSYPKEAGELGLGGEVDLIFTLNRSGSLTSLRLLHSSGFPVLDEEALRAIRAAAPFDPFPPQLGEESWNIRGSFHYISSRYRRN
jgi:periplasmic protein TonB